ncbi:FxSxx-COOH system tetratricopeptide repeat protein [Phytohabitans rumicis]|uniref:Tetratricopeptide repeat protein n=1 Tax=Phytohabitans rumicis TaxID=1076125 RepID=A0A6V8L804_9ACTN|nr:FxSxx-COOH system tetratricopeptide repeat protein [Phytohabitans rumicis]GFJ93392.1 tetratricopeptide repeat protein [Phytohabitans rumicis]
MPIPVPWSDYSADQVEQLMAALLTRLMPEAQRVDGSGGDGGVDVRVPAVGGLHIYEIKRFAERLKPGQRQQIQKSLLRAVRTQPRMVAWTLVVPLDPTPTELEWFESHLQGLSPVPITWMGRTTIETHLSAHDDLLRTFAPGSVETRALDRAVEALGRQMGDRPLTAPQRVGVVPAPATSFQERREIFEDFPLGETVVLSGLGGVGKTQLAADFIRGHQTDATVVVWATASSRDLVLATYAEAARVVLGPQDSVQQAADRLLAWLATTEDIWLVVLDDVQTPADLRGLWPQGSSGRVVVTTRRRDAALAGHRRRTVDVDVFSVEQAARYLRSALREQHPLGDDIDGVATDLQGLPLALAQAAAFMLDRQLRCSEYRRRFADRRRRLSELLPEPEALPDEHRDTVATTWSLSIDAANRLAPVGMARPLMELLSVLEPESISAGLVADGAARNWLSYAIWSAAGSTGDIGAVDIDTIRDGLRTLYRLSLLRQDDDIVRVHALVQRVTREGLDGERRSSVIWAAADALLGYWLRGGHSGELTLTMRANVDALRRHDQGELIAGGHKVLILAGTRQGEAGDPRGAAEYFDNLLAMSAQQLGPDHPDVLELRGHAARWRANAGDPTRAISIHEELVKDFARDKGPDDVGTIVARANLAVCRAQAGALADGIHEMEQVLADCERLLGAHNRHTFDARSLLAGMYGEAGVSEAALAMFAQVAVDRLDALGPDHRETLAAQGAHARWLIEFGDPRAAIVILRRLLDARTQRLGPDHPDTLATRGNLANALGKSGDVRHAADDFDALLADCVRVMGPNHPETLTVRNNHLLYNSADMDPDEAANAWVDLIDDSTRIHGRLAPETLTSMHNFGEWLALAGHLDQAAGWLQVALTRRAEVLGAEHPHTLATGAFLAQTRDAMTRRTPSVTDG